MRMLLTFSLLLAGASAALAAPPVFRVEPDTIRADSVGTWHVSLVIENPAEWGLYVDSLRVEWRNLDEPEGSASRAGTLSLQGLVPVVAPAGAGEQTGMVWNAPADFERGSLRFRLQVHDAQKQVHRLEASVVVAGSDFYDLYPAAMLEAGTGRVEVVHMPAPEASRPAPGVVYVPSQGMSARIAMRWTRQLRNRGYSVTVVSLPGSGRSTGSADRAGPASVAAVEAALASVARRPDVDSKRLAIWGVGEGATAGLLAAAHQPQLLAVVAQDASYDAWATYRALDERGRADFVREAGRDSAAWRARSPLASATASGTPVLVLQTSESATPAAAAAFAAARLGKQLPVESRISNQEPRPIWRTDAARLGLDFLARRLRRP